MDGWKTIVSFWDGLLMDFLVPWRVTPLKTNLDTQNDGLEKVTLKIWLSMLDFWGVV